MYLTLSKSNSSYGFFGKKKQETPPKPTENKVVSPKKEAKPSLEQIMVHPLTDDKLMELIFLEDDFVNRMINKPRLECLLEIYKVVPPHLRPSQSTTTASRTPSRPTSLKKFKKPCLTPPFSSSLWPALTRPPTNLPQSESSPTTALSPRLKLSVLTLMTPPKNYRRRVVQNLSPGTLEAEKTVRSRKTLMNFDVDRVLNEEKDAHTTLVASTMESKDLNDGLLKRNLQDQADIIKAKIEKRRNSNFLKCIPPVYPSQHDPQ
jgi:hypothetical protein